jgi:hypothetical protein
LSQIEAELSQVEAGLSQIDAGLSQTEVGSVIAPEGLSPFSPRRESERPRAFIRGLVEERPEQTLVKFRRDEGELARSRAAREAQRLCPLRLPSPIVCPPSRPRRAVLRARPAAASAAPERLLRAPPNPYAR